MTYEEAVEEVKKLAKKRSENITHFVRHRSYSDVDEALSEACHIESRNRQFANFCNITAPSVREIAEELSDPDMLDELWREFDNWVTEYMRRDIEDMGFGSAA